jgi:rod shape-determining protein MreD
MASLWQNPAGRVGRLGLLGLTLFILVILSAVPLHLFNFSNVRPAFLLAAVFYWAAFHPHVLPPMAVFVLGIFVDLISFLPLGLSALVLVATQWVVKSQRKFLLGQRFIVLWAAAALVAFLASVAQWAAVAVFSGGLFSIHEALISAFLTALLFPLMAPVLHLVGKALSPLH